MQIESKLYENWDDYQDKHAEIRDIETAKILDDYEEDIYRFVFGLFV